MKENQKLSKVFLYSAILVFLMVLLGVFFPKQFGEVSGQIGSWIINTFGWYYMITMTFIVFFSLFLIFSPIGKLRLGKPDDEPEFKTISWLAMLFSAGMGIGLVFYGATEPMTHYLTPPNAKPETNAAIMDAMRSAFFHYGIHPWAMYGIVALSLAYFQFRKNEDGLISKTLRPLFGDKVDGTLGIVIDVLAVFATVIGVAVSLGVGTLQINGGLNYLFGVPQNIWVQSLIILIVTVLFLISAWSGLSKGIQYLSNLNMGLAGILLLITLIVGPTILIFKIMTSATGLYFDEFIFNSLDVAPLNPNKAKWLESWSIYYWGWWMSWSPFVGIFIARVSKGRSVREFVIAVILVPTLVSILWFSVFGVTGIEVAKATPELFKMSPETQLFGIFNELPLGLILSVIAMLLVGSFFITSADSATFVLGMQTSHGSITPTGRVKVIWGLLLSLIAFVLLLSSGGEGLGALQSAAIISALPFSVVIILMLISFYKDANLERRHLGLTLTPDKERMREYVSESRKDENYELDRKTTDDHVY
ncbi:BCCT family transporter [Staphylococcus delphini]|uniref:BCCT family transporter n=1 Tax=Staphylococcus delphini TaxID=53344 RepID=UPI003364E7BF